MERSDLDIVHQYREHSPVDVFGLIEALGISCETRPMSAGDSGRIIRSDGGYAIVVNSEEGEQRRRFTAAHELAHYLLHRDMLDEKGHLDRLFSDAAMTNPSEPFSPAHEVEANKLAAELLMPSQLIKEKYEEGTKSAKDLASFFQVSPAAMEIRLHTLGLT